jgi:hypothetical protein
MLARLQTFTKHRKSEELRARLNSCRRSAERPSPEGSALFIHMLNRKGGLCSFTPGVTHHWGKRARPIDKPAKRPALEPRSAHRTADLRSWTNFLCGWTAVSLVLEVASLPFPWVTVCPLSILRGVPSFAYGDTGHRRPQIAQ